MLFFFGCQPHLSKASEYLGPLTAACESNPPFHKSNYADSARIGTDLIGEEPVKRAVASMPRRVAVQPCV